MLTLFFFLEIVLSMFIVAIFRGDYRVLFCVPCCVLAINWKMNVHTVCGVLQLQRIVITPLSSGSKRGYKRKQERMCGSKGIGTI